MARDIALIDVVIPYRADTPERTAALEWVLAKWRSVGVNPIVGRVDPAAPWAKATAVASVLPICGADTLIVADADVWCDAWDDAVDAIRRYAWAVPHRRLLRLTRTATADVYAGAALTDTLTTDEPVYLGHAGGGIVAVRRDLYDTAPLDPRFVGWGHEDDAWAIALRTLGGPGWRGTAPLFHLWHPPQARESRTRGSAASVALYRDYCAAADRAPRMRTLLAGAQVP